MFRIIFIRNQTVHMQSHRQTEHLLQSKVSRKQEGLVSTLSCLKFIACLHAFFFQNGIKHVHAMTKKEVLQNVH